VVEGNWCVDVGTMFIFSSRLCRGRDAGKNEGAEDVERDTRSWITPGEGLFIGLVIIEGCRSRQIGWRVDVEGTE